MKIEEYLEERGWSLSEFCRRIQLNRKTIEAIMQGKNSLWYNVIKVVKFSEGKISFNDLIPEENQAEDSRKNSRIKKDKMHTRSRSS